MDKSRSMVAGHAVAMLTIVVWGTTFVSTRILLTEFSPSEILFFRFVVGYIALFAVYPCFVRTKSIRDELLFIGAGFSGVTMYFLFQNIALVHTYASNVGIIISIAPFFTAVLAHFFLEGEDLTPQFFAGFVVAMIGIILVVFNGSYVLKLSPKGDVLAILACVCWGVYSIFMKKISARGYHNIGSTRRVFFYGVLLLMPLLPKLDFHLGLDRFLEPANVMHMLYLGLGASALCFVTWNWSVSILGAVKTSVYIYLSPVITIFVSYFVLHETITGTAVIGVLLTLAGLFLSEKNVRKEEKTEEISMGS